MSKLTKINDPCLGIGTFLLEGSDTYTSVSSALKTGYRLIDTAAVYQNEREVGKAIIDSNINRESILVSTKLYAKKIGYDVAIEECKKSLELLGLSYIDIYFIHWMPRRYEDLLDTWRGLEYLYEHGYCKAIGICNITLYYLDKLLKDAKTAPMYCQIEFHPFLQQELFLEYCKSNNIKVIGYGLFAKGLVFKNEALKKLAEVNQTTIANLVLSFGISKGVIPLVKSKDPVRVQANYCNNFELSAELLLEMQNLNDGVRVYRDPENNPYV
ncbi:MAG: aldo/keto reductase [Anaeroplasmataceae bacterium]|nr:aldo/keto reductase [Anaeroplasmataceae bacterium]